jgi:hypothetical protein
MPGLRARVPSSPSRMPCPARRPRPRARRPPSAPLGRECGRWALHSHHRCPHHRLGPRCITEHADDLGEVGEGSSDEAGAGDDNRERDGGGRRSWSETWAPSQWGTGWSVWKKGPSMHSASASTGARPQAGDRRLRPCASVRLWIVVPRLTFVVLSSPLAAAVTITLRNARSQLSK